MKTVHISFFSQLDEEGTIEHKRSICALVCVKMILHSRDIFVSFEDIFKEAQYIGGKESAGWSHETIIRILRNHGVLAYRQEFVAHTIDSATQHASPAPHSEEFITKGILKIKSSIDEGNPVCVSVKAGFSQNNEDHMVLVVGYEEDRLIILDPILKFDQNPIYIPIEKFKTYWKGLSIFVG